MIGSFSLFIVDEQMQMELNTFLKILSVHPGTEFILQTSGSQDRLLRVASILPTCSGCISPARSRGCLGVWCRTPPPSLVTVQHHLLFHVFGLELTQTRPACCTILCGCVHRWPLPWKIHLSAFNWLFCLRSFKIIIIALIRSLWHYIPMWIFLPFELAIALGLAEDNKHSSF